MRRIRDPCSHYSPWIRVESTRAQQLVSERVARMGYCGMRQTLRLFVRWSLEKPGAYDPVRTAFFTSNRTSSMNFRSDGRAMPGSPGSARTVEACATWLIKVFLNPNLTANPKVVWIADPRIRFLKLSPPVALPQILSR